MKKIISSLATLALAISLAAPMFAATGAKAVKGQSATQSNSAKATVKQVKATNKSAKKVKKSTKKASKSSTKTVKSATPQDK